MVLKELSVQGLCDRVPYAVTIAEQVAFTSMQFGIRQPIAGCGQTRLDGLQQRRLW